MVTSYIGKSTSRVDGPAKMTGKATYAAEYNVPNLAYGYLVTSTIARGKINQIHVQAALAVPGVLHVFTHENVPRLAWRDRSYRDEVAPPGSPFRPLHDAEIKFSGQPVALVVAETFEQARYAASVVRVEYEPDVHATKLERQLVEAYKPKERTGLPATPKPRGKAVEAFAGAEVKLDAEYRTPAEHHNPMEMYATTVLYAEDGKLTVFDKTQGVQNVQSYLCSVFSFSKDDVRVVAPYIGGAFGSGLRPQYQVFLAVLAARELKRSVRVSLTRQQMFAFGHRPATWQRIALGASRDGNLQALMHEAISETSRFEDYSETIVNWSGLLYKCDNVKFDSQVAQLDLHTPCDMRAPGAGWGVYAIECAMDELAAKLGMDPVELRLKNYAEKDHNEDLPFSSKELRDCYRQAAEKFGWEKRSAEPRSMRGGNSLIGWGMATGAWEAQQFKASAKAVLTANGQLTVSSATMDIGTGTYTIMTQLAAEWLGLPFDHVTFKLGDSFLSASPVEGGSWTAATIGSAVKAACDKVRERLFQLAHKMENSPLADAKLDDVTFAEGQIRLGNDCSRSISLTKVMKFGNLQEIEEEATAAPSSEHTKYARYAHSAIFAEVRVDEDFGTIYVPRVVSAVAAGRILNPKTARSQVMGGIVWGIGMALEEEGVLDHAFGRHVTRTLADYHVPVNADIHDIDVIFVKERDEIVNPLGVKGLGEIGLVGVAAAIANAVYHATGKRIRELPITPDKLLSQMNSTNEAST